jgi:alpha-beta hydrolase superfamily lysophospholipase
MGFETAASFSSPTGALLSLRQAPASGDARAILLIAHGLAEHAARYQRFARLLSFRGMQVYAWDHRGHGHTTAPDAPLGRFAAKDGADRVLEDLRAVRDHAAAANPGLPVVLFGHSMGAMIATAAAEAYPTLFDGLAIWNADLDPGLAGRAGTVILKAERFFKGSDVPSAYAPRFTFEAWARTIAGARTEFDWLSRDADAVRAYIDDPLCGFSPSVSMWLDVLELAACAGRSDRLARLPKHLPVNIVGGSADPATRGGKAMRWLARRMTALGMTNIDLTVYDGMRHETLNEIGSDDAMRAFSAWVDGIVARQAAQRPEGNGEGTVR